MVDIEIVIKDINLVDLLGVNDRKLNYIKKQFPNLRVIARSNSLLLKGNELDVEKFENRIKMFIQYFKRYGELTLENIENLMSEETVVEKQDIREDVILYGHGGKLILARTPNQKKILEAVKINDMVFAIGPAGTGKTYTAVALAVKALKEKRVKRIIISRPAVEAGENLGFLPGDLKEKLDPYLQPLFDALYDMIPPEKLTEYMEKGVLQIAPLAFMRGRTLNNAFVILDEAQNTTKSQMKMFLTRMGKAAKFVITGDRTQVDLPKNQKSGLIEVIPMLEKTEGISIIKLDGSDVVRHKLVKKIIEAYDELEIKKNI